MPQLDIITISIQTIFIFYSIFSLLLVMQGLLFPDYFILNFSKKVLWYNLNTLITQIKYYTYLNYSHLIVAISFFIKTNFENLNTLKFLIENFSIHFLNNFKRSILMYLNLFLYKTITFKNLSFIEKSNIRNLGQQKKLNFFFRKKTIGMFLISYNVEKFMITFFNIFTSKRRRRKIEIKAGIKYWTLEDKIFIKNTKKDSCTINPIFKLNF
jgi:hypothetical protein